MRLDGSVALVTGAGSGIGQAVAVELSRRGASTILVGRRSQALDKTRHMLADPEKGWIMPADLTDGEQRQRMAARVRDLSPHLDMLVNNAGQVQAGDMAGQDDAVWQEMLTLNLLAPMSLTRHLLPLLRQSGQGRVVNVGSMFGDIAFPFFAAYSASKFGLRGWSEALRRELADQGVGVTYCAPRGTDTPAAQGFQAYVQAFSMRLDSPQSVASHMVDGIAKDRRDIYPTGPERLFLLVQRLFPGLIDQGLRADTRTAMGLSGKMGAGA